MKLYVKALNAVGELLAPLLKPPDNSDAESDEESENAEIGEGAEGVNFRGVGST